MVIPAASKFSACVYNFLSVGTIFDIDCSFVNSNSGWLIFTKFMSKTTNSKYLDLTISSS